METEELLKMPLDRFCEVLLNLTLIRNGEIERFVENNDLSALKSRAELANIVGDIADFERLNLRIRYREELIEDIKSEGLFFAEDWPEPPINRLDIYNYLEHITKDFDKGRCEAVLTEIRHIKVEIYEEEGYNLIEYLNIKYKWGLSRHKISDQLELLNGKSLLLYRYAQQILRDKLGYSAPDNQTRGDKLWLPNGLNTDEARKYFARALERGYMKKTETGCKWLFGGDKGQSRLGYFCNKVFAQPRPINKLEQIFGVKKLSASISNAEIEAKRDDVKQWRKEMDENIFFD